MLTDDELQTFERFATTLPPGFLHALAAAAILRLVEEIRAMQQECDKRTCPDGQ